MTGLEELQLKGELVTGTETYRVGGMSCGGCERSVELAVAKLAGVVRVRADAKNSSMEVEFDGAPLDVSALREAVEKSGYRLEGR